MGKDAKRKGKKGDGGTAGRAEGSPLSPEGSWAGYTEAQRTELGRIRSAVEGRLSGHRLEHVLGVASTARSLAERYGADPFEAEAAGLLHDWDKRLTPDELWEKVAAYGVDLHGFQPGDATLVPLLHGWTAAASLPELFPELPEEVFRAVERHTVGSLGMSGLDMVVFVADMLEPTRSGGGVERLRALVGEVGLDGLFSACVRRSIAYVLETGRAVYPGAVEVWNAWCASLPDAERAAQLRTQPA